VNVATALVALDRPADASAELTRALDAYLELEYEEGVSYCLDVAAAVSLAHGEAADAAALAAAAGALRAKHGVAPEPVEQRLHERTVAAAAQPDPRTLSVDEALALVRRTLVLPA
jgi:hypothetical protein